MKKLIILALLVLPLTSLGQENQWTQEELKVLEKFSLNKEDHRGLVLSQNDNNCHLQAASIKEGIESFFKSVEMRDLTVVCISSLDPTQNDKTMDLKQVVQLYLESKNNTK